jgi:hypothetical protein
VIDKPPQQLEPHRLVTRDLRNRHRGQQAHRAEEHQRQTQSTLLGVASLWKGLYCAPGMSWPGRPQHRLGRPQHWHGCQQQSEQAQLVSGDKTQHGTHTPHQSVAFRDVPC